MARPKKDGLDYFPFDVDFFDDDKILLLSASGGADAVTVYLKLLCLIYRSEEGFFYRWDDARAQLLAIRMPTHIDLQTIQAAVQSCISVGLFDADVYAAQGVLTSLGIQRRYITASSARLRRRLARGMDVVFSADCMLLTEADVLSLLGYGKDDAPAGSVCIAQKDDSAVVCHEQTNDDIMVCREQSTQRKEKERKEKERKEDERKTNSADAPLNTAPAAQSSSSDEHLGWYGPKHTVQLAPKIYERLSAQYGQPAVDDRVANMEAWVQQSGKRYRNNAETLEQWLKDDSPPSGGVLPAQSQAPPYAGKKTGAHCFSQRSYTDEELENLYTDIDHLND